MLDCTKQVLMVLQNSKGIPKGKQMFKEDKKRPKILKSYNTYWVGIFWKIVNI